ncbi:MAG: NAD-dependent epimerase/dehydratase family protein [Thiohalocapsa sp.]|jgi:nucleoside-diphosphate-sugar epimerase|uniref:NAD-dependent epimerase/dehydratase family protein n=1 Tax=Thiohalocapsa sp. TaxID=2497641 RepID=UPI0025DAEF99|nr:NAD-dependent epimerase/dehydratase family protein [Thiohalocapsa sp.]MCG6941963.1 NAD-dependent epimerase/dehydratase family protein [Thiohalocapsa sp.]
MTGAHPRRYLVTGANGFVGRALCTYLGRRGDAVRALVRQPTDGPWDETVACDLGTDPLPGALMNGIDGVFHLAGVAHMQDIAAVPDATYERVNVAGTSALLDAAAAAGVRRFVYFSSIKAVADPGEQCVDERWEAPPTDAYGRSKREAEQRVRDAGRQHGLHVCNLRPCLVYGPGVKGNLARMIDAIDRGRFPPLPDFHNRRSMIGVDDLLDAAWLAMHNEAANGQTFIVADGVDYSTRALFLAISEALGKSVPAWTLPRSLLSAAALTGDLLGAVSGRSPPFSSAVLHRLRGWNCFRASHLRETLGWRPRMCFADALPEMIRARRET